MGDISDELTCSVCLQMFNNPYLLPCGHSFCLNCVQRLRNNLDFRCPDCRRECRRWEDIVKNYTLASIVDVYRAEKTKAPRLVEYSERKAAYWLVLAGLALLVTAVLLKKKLEDTAEQLLDSQQQLRMYQNSDVIIEDERTSNWALRIAYALISLPYWCLLVLMSPFVMLWEWLWWITSSCFTAVSFGFILILTAIYNFLFSLFNVIVYSLGLTVIFQKIRQVLRRQHTS